MNLKLLPLTFGSLMMGSALQAQLYWDTNGATAGAGNPADGTWDGTETNWTSDSLGESATGTYVSGSDVVFSAGSDAASAAVTVSGVQIVSSLTFEEGDVTISGGSLDDSDGSNVAVSVAGGASATINSSLTFNADFDVDGEITMSRVGTGGFVSMSGTGILSTARLDARLTVNSGTVVYTAGNLGKLKEATINSGGILRLESSGFANTKQNLTVNTGGSFEMVAGLSQTISQLSGGGSISGEAGSSLTVGGDNKSATFDGDISGEIDIVSAGTGSFTLSDSSSMKFVVGANGESNSILGDGVNLTTTSLNGEFIFDLVGADLSLGNEWLIVDVANLDVTFGGTFSVQGFTETADVWSNGSGLEFSELTGNLTVVPEASSFALLSGLGALGVVGLRRRLDRVKGRCNG